MARIVVLGAGVAGVPAAYSLKARLTPADDLTVVSDTDRFRFVPSNPLVAVGWRTANEVTFPIAPYLRAHGIDFIRSGARHIDPAGNRVTLGDGSSIDYDYLVVATGPAAAFDEIAGLDREHSPLHAVIHLEHARRAAAAYRQFLERPAPVVIAGAPHAGVLGPMYECAFLIDEDLRRRGLRRQVPVTVLTPEPFAGHLGLGERDPTRQLLEAALAQREIECITDARLLRVDAQHVHYEAGRRGASLQRLECGFGIVWPALRGVAPLRDSPELTDERGLVTVDEYLRHPRHRNVFAAGLSVARPPLAETPIPVGPPVSVYSIQNEVDTVVHNLLASRDGEAPVNHVPRPAEWLKEMGDIGEAYLSAPHIPLRNINWLKEGRWVHEAKLEFDEHFIQGLKLLPGSDSGIRTRVASAVKDMLAEHLEGGYSPLQLPHRHQVLRLVMEGELRQELLALAAALGVEPEDVAARLLKAALHDARAHLDDTRAQTLERTRRRILFEEMPEAPPDVGDKDEPR